MDALAKALNVVLSKYDGWLKVGVWHHPVSGKEAMDAAFWSSSLLRVFRLFCTAIFIVRLKNTIGMTGPVECRSSEQARLERPLGKWFRESLSLITSWFSVLRRGSSLFTRAKRKNRRGLGMHTPDGEIEIIQSLAILWI
jgi:hypothetical protein